jgi:hypothetical protein
MEKARLHREGRHQRRDVQSQEGVAKEELAVTDGAVINGANGCPRNPQNPLTPQKNQ